MGEGGFARLRAGQLAALTCRRHVIHSRSASNPRFTKAHTKHKPHPDGWGKVDSPACGRARSAGNVPPARFLTRLPFESTLHKNPYQAKAPSHKDGAFAWWGKVDSNHRRHCQQIYSLSPLATREFPHIRLLTVRWSWWTDSNPRPADYKSAALPAELHQHIRSARQPAYNSKYSFICQ